MTIEEQNYKMLDLLRRIDNARVTGIFSGEISALLAEIDQDETPSQRMQREIMP